MPHRMPGRPSRADHDAAVARRLEQLSAELAGVRGGPGTGVPEPGAWDAGPPPAPWEEPAVDAPAVVEGPRVPVPGRHAARRSGRLAGGAGRLVPEPVRGRVGLGPAQVAVVAVLVALGLAVTAWWVVRSDPEPVTPLAPSAPSAPAAGEAAPLATPAPGTPGSDEPDATGTSTVTVDVAGKVRRPGIAVLDAGSRVVDALEAAGGARPGVDLSGLNLARLLVDGEQVLVGTPAAVAVPPGTTGTTTPTVPGAGPLVNLNTAGLEELETLPEVGPVTAQAILTWRETNGGFTAVEELLEVDGIGDATLESMAPFCTV